MAAISLGRPAALPINSGIIAPSKSDPSAARLGGRDLDAILTDELAAEVQPDEATAFGHRRQLFVGQIAGRGGDGMGVGMGGQQRAARKPRHIPEPRLVEVAEIKEDAKAFAFRQEPLARLRQPRPGIG
jgi:hypothetical protein